MKVRVALVGAVAVIGGCAPIVGADFGDYVLEEAAGGQASGGGPGAGAGGTGAGSADPPSVLVIEVITGNPIDGPALETALNAAGDFGPVALLVLDDTAAPPSAEALQAYDAVVMTSRSFSSDSAGLAMALEAFVDGGGKLVLGRDAMCTIEGGGPLPASLAPEYRALTPGELTGCPMPGPTVAPGDHPMLEGVEGVALVDEDCCTTTVAANAQLIGSWTNGRPLVATRVVAGGLRVDINARADKAAVLFVNALRASLEL